MIQRHDPLIETHEKHVNKKDRRAQFFSIKE